MTDTTHAPPTTTDHAAAVRDSGLRTLATTRWLTDRLIEPLTPDQWMHQFDPDTNHPMFNIGHIAWCDAGFLRAAAGETDAVPPSYESLFEEGCTPTARAGDYPDPAELVRCLARAREALVEHLSTLPADRLAAPPADDRLADIVPTIADLPAFIAMHEGLHAGQIMLTRRALGLPFVLGQ